MKGSFIGQFLCAIGAHDFRERKNGKATERVCMREGCKKRAALYRIKDGKSTLWNEKKIPLRGHSFVKMTKEGKKA